MSFYRRHLQFMSAAVLGIIAFLTALLAHSPLAFSLSANVFFVAYIALVLFEMPKLTADYLSRKARKADLPVALIFAVTVVVVGASILSLFQVINTKSGTHPFALSLSLLSVPLGWFTLHAMAAVHYAHVYWQDDDVERPGKQPVGGLDFPGDTPPEGWDFLYFATVIGMTAQTADTGITSSHMRRVVLVHSIVSFFFNTVIVAAAVNLAVSLGGN